MISGHQATRSPLSDETATVSTVLTPRGLAAGATARVLDGCGIEVRFTAEVKYVCLHTVQTNPETHPVSYVMGTQILPRG